MQYQIYCRIRPLNSTFVLSTTFPYIRIYIAQKKRRKKQLRHASSDLKPSLESTFESIFFIILTYRIERQREKKQDRSERNAGCASNPTLSNSIHLLNSTRTAFGSGLTPELWRRARSNLRQLSGGRRLDFANQEFVFPRGERDADGNLERRKVRREWGDDHPRRKVTWRLPPRSENLYRERDSPELYIKIDYRNVHL